MTAVHRIVIDTDLPSGLRAKAFVSHDVIGVCIDGQTAIAHHRWMDAEQLSALAQCITELDAAS